MRWIQDTGQVLLPSNPMLFHCSSALSSSPPCRKLWEFRSPSKRWHSWGIISVHSILRRHYFLPGPLRESPRSFPTCSAFLSSSSRARLVFLNQSILNNSRLSKTCWLHSNDFRCPLYVLCPFSLLWLHEHCSFFLECLSLPPLHAQILSILPDPVHRSILWSLPWSQCLQVISLFLQKPIML